MTASRLEQLSLDECLALLRSHEFGRIAFVVSDFPVVVPVRYRFIEVAGCTWIALRVRPGSMVEEGSVNVAFQIDGRDRIRRRSWSVLARGTLQHVDPSHPAFREPLDRDPSAANDDVWFVVEPFEITGRRLRHQQAEPAFDPRGYH